MQAGATPNIAIMWADQNQKNKSAFADFPDPVSANQSYI